MDYVSVINKRQFVIDQLAMYAGETKKLGDSSTLVLCPFHAEKTPSFRIFHSPTTVSPSGKCYGCGVKAFWNDLAPLLGLQPFSYQKPKEEFVNLQVLGLAIEPERRKEEIRLTALPRNKKWRGISTNLLIDLGAKKCQVNHPEHGWLKPAVYLPVLMRGKLRGYIKARIKKHEELPSYVNSHGQWSKTHGLFPYDYAVKLMEELGSTTLVLVEGPRDALRLLAAGIPAICILGTQSWTDTKTRMLELSGCERVILLFDGDCAGIEATEKVGGFLRSMFKIITIRLWNIKGSPYLQVKDKKEPSKYAKRKGISLWDPGSMPDWIVNRIKSKYFGA